MTDLIIYDIFPTNDPCDLNNLWNFFKWRPARTGDSWPTDNFSMGCERAGNFVFNDKIEILLFIPRFNSLFEIKYITSVCFVLGGETGASPNRERSKLHAHATQLGHDATRSMVDVGGSSSSSGTSNPDHGATHSPRRNTVHRRGLCYHLPPPSSSIILLPSSAADVPGDELLPSITAMIRRRSW